MPSRVRSGMVRRLSETTEARREEEEGPPMTDEADNAGRVRQAVRAALILFVLLLAGCKSGPQRGAQSEHFLRSDDESVLLVHWTRGDRQIGGTIDILERKPGGEIGKTKLIFDGESDGMNVR